MTFSIVVAQPATGLLGAATASFSLAVGNSVPGIRPGVGAVVSQAWTNRSLRGRTLHAVDAGVPPGEVLVGLPRMDPGYPRRQLALIRADGDWAVHTGEECTAWAGHRPVVGDVGGLSGVACGNVLAGPAVLEAVVEVVRAARPDGPFVLADLLLGALAAGQAAGGDLRGQQSAAVLVGAGPRQPWEPPDLEVDLRVDDHPRPLKELARLAALLTPRPA